ncbi:MAG: tRNA uridine-5-carboxymethylaminomethyl(34) synthesis GTPase MnmE [Nitrospiraceae bacterium]|nr:tRNA uridine-5-carboxymethylaminomethyl(34) synthesis GTPase MnmE [Nitrospiraceae bacterium]
MAGALDDTICAIATPPGEGGIGIIRLSGPRAIDIASRLVRLRSAAPLESVPSRVLSLAEVGARVTAVSPASGHPLDEALVAVMRRPHSYTGEDVVELQCHGGPVILDQLCRLLLAEGARLAEPGEFTKRAFLNGRLDLVQAEAVLDTIRAKTARSLSVAQAQRRGDLSREIAHVREQLVIALAHVEAALDFVEEDIEFVPHDELARILQIIIDRLSKLVATEQEGRIWREGAAVAILGRPNVGKSSLMNALLRTDRAIVTPIAGTTRDVLEESLSLAGIPIRLVDTAGIRPTYDPVEAEGIRRSQVAWGSADLALILVDGSEPLTDDDRALLAEPAAKEAVVLVNKCDLPMQTSAEAVQAICPTRRGILEISVQARTGLDALRETIRRQLTPAGLESQESVLVTNLRQAAALERALHGARQAAESLGERRAGECIAMDLRIAADALGEVTGAITTDDILERIFSEFCIGK